MQTMSMTGYGKSKTHINHKVLLAEFRSVNSKQLDLNIRLPLSLRHKEQEFRALVSDTVERGKVDLFLNFESESNERRNTFNKQLALKYYQELQQFALETKSKKEHLLPLVFNMPDVFTQETNNIDSKEWNKIKTLVQNALKDFNAFRKAEGLSIGKEIAGRIKIILSLLTKVDQADKLRLTVLKERIRKNINAVVPSAKTNKNRFEEELIYYIEKMDITEEKVRLKTHCTYFLETMKEKSSGRKLGFISQEIGREINTIGSKANDADIQKTVVQMKDELEKVKEQLMNVL